MSRPQALTGARIFDGVSWHDGEALVVADSRIQALLPLVDLADDIEMIDVAGQIIVPGFIDLQVNGGGGVLLNEVPTAAGIAQICAAHAKFGTTGLLPTLITDTPQVTAAAIEAGKQARREAVPGFLGLHLEGPHLSLARKGAHDPALIRPMQSEDMERILSCRGVFDALMTTIAPESVTLEQVRTLADAGFIVSIGHTDSTYDIARRYAAAGARTVTHIFNAMSPLAHREPGIVGAALDIGSLHVGMIADGIHVHPVAMGVALRSKNGPGRIFLVTDAMSPIGTDLTSFTLNGREILRRDGRLTLADGTLAGADIDMISSVRFVHETLGLPLEEALRTASVYPAEAARLSDRKGTLKTGFDADFVVLSQGLGIRSTWIGGNCVYRAD
ncbi:N-acetylglucosamine-6-phosphate deacetylase [Neorhizobium lilium]|uniref:N-acetylglucosamine-6-phosphate deacetylase n=1 Tax=Neorhizobium lilium TaxID=2503024 RepID=A0A3S3TWM2_9HYPH|nr:N-acetylglucosamine-6-phosphate deacetylase [Neorhizobium lilium]RWX76556.1 N-acetylglucosamine-6-phosphate deacetylase [Neorhizobium lilium]